MSRRVPYEPVEGARACVADQYVGDPNALCHSNVGRPAKEVDRPELESVKGERNTALYNAHSYHTKVPPEAIVPFLNHFTRPGDVVLDPFSGSGMTGVAAVMTGRRAILNDLSVAGAHLGFNHTRACDTCELAEVATDLCQRLRERFKAIYRARVGSKDGYVHYTLWSPRYECPTCKEVFAMWDVIDQETGRVGSSLTCSGCKKSAPRRQFRLVEHAPALVNVEVQGRTGARRENRAVTPEDERFIKSFRRDAVSDWYPTVKVDAEREMYIRSALQLQGINTIADFYTPRNLLALSILWDEIGRVKNERVRQVLSFAFTNTAWHGTRMRRFNARGGQRPLTGTLYIPQLSVEVNVLEVFRHKVEQLVTFYGALPATQVEPPVIRVGSATDLTGIPDESIDYVFTDPPFGSNIFYADCNLIWESWLGGITPDQEEMVVNRSRKPAKGGKTVADYQRLMHGAFVEMRRVLKPNAWATLVFHNTDARVWRALQDAAGTAGFAIEQAAELDRQQQSHKGYKGRAGTEQVAHFDVIVSMRKGTIGSTAKRRVAPESVMRRLICDLIAAHPASEEFSVQRAHSHVIRMLANDGYDLGSIGFERVKTIAEEELGKRVAKQTQMALF